MIKIINLVLTVVLFISCSEANFDTHDHSAGGHEDHGHGGGEIENIRFTEFTKMHELFAEMTPLIQGKEGEFVVHFTKLSDFKPITRGSLNIELSGAEKRVIRVDSIARAGIFLAAYTPKTTGEVGIKFIYNDGFIKDTILVPAQKVFASLEEAKKYEKPAESGITFLKEEAWKIDFSLFQVEPASFTETVKATGKIINNPADEALLTSTTSGVVEFVSSSITPGARISAGTTVFRIKSAGLREDNLELRYSQAKSNYDRAKKEFDRIAELYKSKISSENEYLAAKANLENAEAIFRNYSQSSEGRTISIKTSKGGYLKKLLVNTGQFVEAGTTLAVMSNNNKLLVQVDIPSKEYNKISGLSDANFVIDDFTINMKALNGKVTGSPITTSSGFVSQYIQIDNKINLQPNSYLTAYLFGGTRLNAIVIPKESVWEDQGNFFVFVQKHGELYEKREVSIEGFDGMNYLISAGLTPGQVVVNKGTYRLVLASKSSQLPTQTHTH